eukprot:TRINITY_DN927_c0_g1_i1.p1 TRINITY_DN927_c0_g1~~TRINITY_DN927_c0_g1_i1.p1  ORF type:complete len:243 (-),score=42.02 TRINITY_DN927_c0_g1_i1:717-1445(-)
MPKKRGFEGDSSATEDLIRLAMKHESLRQDFNELCEETDAVRKQLHKAKAMKERLSAEVRFLRRRYKFLKGGSPGKQQSEGTSEKPVPRSIRQDNGTDYASLSTALPPSIPCRVLQPNLQNKVDVNASVRPPAIPVEEKALYKSTRREAMPFTGIAAGFPHSLPETRETETREFQVFWEPLRAVADGDERSNKKQISAVAEGNGMANDLRLSIFKDIPNGFVTPGRSGKRKIPLQDSMALKV